MFHLNRAVEGLRKYESAEHLCSGLLIRVANSRDARQFAAAPADLDEARKLAEELRMHLHLVDCGIEQTRMCLAQGRCGKAQALSHYESVVELMKGLRCGRRMPDAEDLRTRPA